MGKSLLVSFFDNKADKDELFCEKTLMKFYKHCLYDLLKGERWFYVC